MTLALENEHFLYLPLGPESKSEAFKKTHKKNIYVHQLATAWCVGYLQLRGEKRYVKDL